MKGALIPLDKLPLPRGTDGNSMHWLLLPTLGANCRERVFTIHHQSSDLQGSGRFPAAAEE